jgi:shikimate dehydrogenase
MADRYGVIGNPIGHSKSPAIHAAFARAAAQDMTYEAILAPLDGFVATVAAFRLEGGKGLNVTLPFKIEAYELCNRMTPRAQAARAVNTLVLEDAEIYGDNTDGVGLITDLKSNLLCPVYGKRVLLLGAGGAARGVLFPLLMESPSFLTIANRTLERALQLQVAFEDMAAFNGYDKKKSHLAVSDFESLAGEEFDIVINATSASVNNTLPPLPRSLFARNALAYDMMYSKSLTPFLEFARATGAANLADGLGMLVEQAAESFCLWRGVRPDTGPVLELMRSQTN